MVGGRRGEMGFLEAMVSVMAVSIVLSMFVGVAASAAVTVSEPGIGIDPSSLGCEVRDGRLVLLYEDALVAYLGDSTFSGISVRTTVPGTGLEAVMTLGDMDGRLSSCRFISNIPGDHGRVLIAVHEVTACV